MNGEYQPFIYRSTTMSKSFLLILPWHPNAKRTLFRLINHIRHKYIPLYTSSFAQCRSSKLKLVSKNWVYGHGEIENYTTHVDQQLNGNLLAPQKEGCVFSLFCTAGQEIFIKPTNRYFEGRSCLATQVSTTFQDVCVGRMREWS